MQNYNDAFTHTAVENGASSPAASNSGEVVAESGSVSDTNLDIYADKLAYTARLWDNGEGFTLTFAPYGNNTQVSTHYANIQDAKFLGVEPVVYVRFDQLAAGSDVPVNGESYLLKYPYIFVGGKKKYILLNSYALHRIGL